MRQNCRAICLPFDFWLFCFSFFFDDLEKKKIEFISATLHKQKHKIQFKKMRNVFFSCCVATDMWYFWFMALFHYNLLKIKWKRGNEWANKRRQNKKSIKLIVFANLKIYGFGFFSFSYRCCSLLAACSVEILFTRIKNGSIFCYWSILGFFMVSMYFFLSRSLPLWIA